MTSPQHEGHRRLLIANGSILRGVGVDDVPEIADVLIVDGVITEIGTDLVAVRDEATEILDATDKLVIPGMINSHYHSHDTLAKGTLEEEPLEYWRLMALPPQYPKRSREEVKARTLLGAYECLRSGMTTVQDMVTLFPFDPEHLEAVVEAYEEIGIRAVVGLQYADKKGISTIPFWEDVFPEELHGSLSTAAEPDADIDQLSYLEEHYLQGPARERVTWALGPSAPERCSTGLLQRTMALAEKYDLQIFTHIYESKGMALQARREYPQYAGSLIRRLQEEGMIGPRVNLAHSVWLLPDEIELLAETGTNVVLNPLSNLKLKSGIPPIHALEEAGVSFGLGCDNCSCSDAQNMFQAMKLFALVAAISNPDPGPNQADRAFHAATAGGAHALDREEDLGRLAPGYRGDVVLMDLTDPTFVPLNSAVRQLVYTESGRGVTDVVVDGRIVIRAGVLQTIDPADLLARIASVVPEFQKDFEQVKKRADGLSGYLLEAHHRTWAEDVGANRLFTGR
ncbi:amidohydrolase family protein [Compostimonas suwonensis]|uniref:Cytosine/adenosine deaminase-related metal-dependent hydrolase n=1 Tax=Compostimonas suwonensis TaxID=1048394 RepID=A0A2M9BZT7_9MICO|nr:amidohydrolase family protein [Compostimonas suwonensis]PJJ63605.1 cytosine/adenosine deaminase-related metal-dependent hydrolase [Compostimonas suwonensis]